VRQINLGTTGLRTSELAFGCSAVLGRTGRKESLRALELAYDAGITMFDTARSYGYGHSEALLGEFLKGKRANVVLSTKFGIVPAKQQAWKQLVKPAVRALVSLLPAFRKLIRSQIKAQFQEGQFTVQVLRSSLEQSLRLLRTDYVDLLFAHSAPASILGDDPLLNELDQLVAEGKVRVTGISSDPAVIEKAFEAPRNTFKAFQFPCNVFDSTLAGALTRNKSQSAALIANHPFGGGGRVMQNRAQLAEISRRPDAPSSVSEKLRDVDDRTLADVALNSILRGTGIQVAVPAMMSPAHLKSNVDAVTNSHFSDEELGWIRTALVRTSSLN
jgi:aryl-alcohol dehydrogenase-like predicted oxidoreductase